MTSPPPGQGPALQGRPIMHQHWRDITFVHWRVDPDRVERYMPKGVRPDVHDGSSWVGLIPFRMVDAGVGPRRPVPWLGTFLETNVRLYSRDGAGRRGVVFLSLDAQRLPVVVGARLLFGTPYQWASMRFASRSVPGDPTGTAVTYAARRHQVPRPRWPRPRGRHSPPGPSPTSRLHVRVGERVAEPAALELFLTARFGLHTTVAGRPLWVPNTHAPWPLHRAEVLELDDAFVAAAGLPGVTDRAPDSVLFSPGVETSFGRPVRI